MHAQGCRGLRPRSCVVGFAPGRPRGDTAQESQAVRAYSPVQVDAPAPSPGQRHHYPGRGLPSLGRMVVNDLAGSEAPENLTSLPYTLRRGGRRVVRDLDVDEDEIVDQPPVPDLNEEDKVGFDHAGIVARDDIEEGSDPPVGQHPGLPHG